MQKKFKVQTPLTPNFITVGTEKLPIADFNESELRQIGTEWTKALIKSAREKRKLRNSDLTKTVLPSKSEDKEILHGSPNGC